MPPKRKSQIGTPTTNSGWTMEMDPTNLLLTSLTGHVPHQSHATVQHNTAVLQFLHGSQPSVSNGCVSSLTAAEHTTSQTFLPPLPSSVQFENNSDAGHVTKPTVSLASCDMTLSVSTKQLKVLVTGCVKQQLFRRVKFFDDDLHGQFDHHPDSVCGIVRKYCNVSAIETNFNWWSETRGKIKCTLGNHCNNCIKAMHLLRFRDGKHGKINGYQKMTGSDADIAYMLQMRQNQVHYISLMDIFAPCIVSNRQERVERRCVDGGVLCG